MGGDGTGRVDEEGRRGVLIFTLLGNSYTLRCDHDAESPGPWRRRPPGCKSDGDGGLRRAASPTPDKESSSSRGGAPQGETHPPGSVKPPGPPRSSLPTAVRPPPYGPPPPGTEVTRGLAPCPALPVRPRPPPRPIGTRRRSRPYGGSRYDLFGSEYERRSFRS